MYTFSLILARQSDWPTLLKAPISLLDGEMNRRFSTLPLYLLLEASGAAAACAPPPPPPPPSPPGTCSSTLFVVWLLVPSQSHISQSVALAAWLSSALGTLFTYLSVTSPAFFIRLQKYGSRRHAFVSNE